MNDNSTALALIGIVATLVTIGGTVINALFKLLNANTKALGELVASNEKIAKATEKGNQEAKERNGHLAELTIQSRDQTLEAIMNVKEQNVVHQVVQHETVEHRDK